MVRPVKEGVFSSCTILPPLACVHMHVTCVRTATLCARRDVPQQCMPLPGAAVAVRTRGLIGRVVSRNWQPHARAVL